MPLDAICIAAVKEELSGRVTGHKIDKVQQPERDIIILTLRGGTETCRLLLSAGHSDTRVHLTEHKFDNPASPPMFCMLLRKHITGARILGITQPPAERALEFALETSDAMGVISRKSLIIEMIGRSPNIILADAEGVIIDCLRRISGDFSSKRAVLPGLFYHPPPQQDGKQNPMTINSEEWRERFIAAGRSMEKRTVDEWLLAAFSAMSPLICRELSWRAYSGAEKRIEAIDDGGEALSREFFKLMGIVNSRGFKPWLIKNKNDEPCDFSYTSILQYEGAMNAAPEDSFSAMLDGFFTQTAQRERNRQRASVMVKTIKTARGRIARKLAVQYEELKKTTQRDLLRECGDIIAANYHVMRKGQKTLVAQDFFAQDGDVREILLDPLKTPQQNAAKYYKEYSKAKNAEKYLTEQILSGENELKYLDSVDGELSLAESEGDLAEIRRELVQTGYIKAQKQAKQKHAQSVPMQFVSSTGIQILAGRNNASNDALTMKTARKSDIWLHTQKIHGSHVIISCNGGEPDDTTLCEAASIAAYYSGARSGGKTPVDYTLVKNVKKPPGGRPGNVIYTDYATILAIPDEELANRLRSGQTLC